MVSHQKLKFYGYVEQKKTAQLYIVKYVLGKRDPRLLSFSRWCQEAPSYKWGVWIDQKGVIQLSWTMLFAFLIKQTSLTDNRQTAELLTPELASAFAKTHVCKLPDEWVMSSNTIAKFLSNHKFTVPISNSISTSTRQQLRSNK